MLQLHYQDRREIGECIIISPGAAAAADGIVVIH